MISNTKIVQVLRLHYLALFIKVEFPEIPLALIPYSNNLHLNRMHHNIQLFSIKKAKRDLLKVLLRSTFKRSLSLDLSAKCCNL
ncbi:hypothetical protein Pse7429DRAFT_0312 [Pseudanabaena biceps PCC 7429]|uniref:Uncharacterized protein n=1 Tax=Pseudanabaena biceps PCC 7429 TaxID=927668 RepID=L8N8P3_9CYAN|nr:hypothetical protein Pse7429DRAFT_0312 [Pseudanabaena biceps PCC 7429]